MNIHPNQENDDYNKIENDFNQQSNQYEIPIQESKSDTAENNSNQNNLSNPNISIDQLKELIKNPQIAQFLKE